MGEQVLSPAEQKEKNAEAVDNRIRLLSIWLSSRKELQASIKRWVIYSDDDALTMGKTTLQTKNDAMEKPVYESLRDNIGDHVIPLRIMHYGGDKHLRCSPDGTLNFVWHNKACKCGANTDSLDPSKTMLSSLSLDAVDVEHLVSDITRREYDDCVQALELDRKNGMVNVPKVRVEHTEEEEMQFAQQRLDANKASHKFQETKTKREALLKRLEGPSPKAPPGMFGPSASDSDSSCSGAPEPPSPPRSLPVPDLVSAPDSDPESTPSRSSSSGFWSSPGSATRSCSAGRSRSRSPELLPRVKRSSSVGPARPRSRFRTRTPERVWKSPTTSLITRFKGVTRRRSNSVGTL